MSNTAEQNRPADRNSKCAGEVGILTFHCSDNFGAMLQAYGLKRFLREHGVQADIVRYAPFFLTGRHWWLPYWPASGLRGWVESLLGASLVFFQRLCIRREYAARRANMAAFRREYLVDARQPRIYSSSALWGLPYKTYIVGSDQIWNPAITYGLRSVYFGDFRSRRKGRVIAYAASLGGASLPPQYDLEFARLIQNVDVVSLREAEAVPYVGRFYHGQIAAVLDPVFLLERTAWQEVERLPAQSDYILVYATEQNAHMAAYVRELSRRTGLRVVELDEARIGPPAELDATAGPAEFLGYIHGAAYVVTNSFHGTAFSILYQKQFLVFAHSGLNARITNVLRLHGLEDRICQTGGDIDAPVDWSAVQARTAPEARKSGAFLLDNIWGRRK